VDLGAFFTARSAAKNRAMKLKQPSSAPAGLCCKEIDCTTPLCGLYIHAGKLLIN
jgi:hypothetical protein